MEDPTQNLKDVVQVGKRKRPRHLFNPRIAACLQNVDNNLEWRKGDPNTETAPNFDFVWVLWILRQIFPKDVVTHFVRMTGGFSFQVHRSLPLPEQYEGPKLVLQFWHDRDLYLTPIRNIYFNVPVHTIVKKKERAYLHYHANTVAWIPNT